MARLTSKIFLLTMMIGVIAILIFGIHTPSVEAEKISIAVLISYKGSPFDETVEGFQKCLSRQRISVNYELFQMGGDSQKVVQVIQNLKTNRPSLIFTLGSLATEATAKEITDIPVIAGMILRSDPLKNASNGTGVFLEFPAETQLKWMQYFLPKIKTIGVIYNPKENRERIEHAARIGEQMGLKIEGRQVDAPQDFMSALNGLSRNVDVLWGVADQLVLNSLTAKHFLLYSFKNTTPFVGLSSVWVKAGGLYALESDYTDNGMQCGEIAFKVIQGTKVSSIPPASPRKITYSLNMNTARLMKIQIPEKLIQEAKQIY